jgi:hypothetical protein
VLCFDLAPVEKVCPGMVPCVDILPLIARDYVHMIATYKFEVTSEEDVVRDLSAREPV